jgi:hypothetical protein
MFHHNKNILAQKKDEKGHAPVVNCRCHLPLESGFLTFLITNPAIYNNVRSDIVRLFTAV